MNMFRRGRKAKDEEDASAQPAHSKTSRSLTRRKKKPEVEVKPSLELNLSLPDSNEFRTSLIMPNLSARFSMLREQDDPMSKLGKAADDSVLFPKRMSRLNLFGHNPLTDIAEVESIRSSIRRPFAEKHGSTISDGYGSDDGGSIMGRSRPGEGNNLFGGRQKLYRVPNGSSKNLPGDGPMLTGGKHMYENDVSVSAFQQYRQQERDQKVSDERPDRSSLANVYAEEGEVARSPSTSFSKNRGTQSSTNSGPSGRRTSTAATSVTSESPVARKGSNAAIAKVKEQDANSSAESVGFAASPSFRKIREEVPRPSYKLSQSKSAANLRENSSRPSPVFNSSNFRAMSPPPVANSQPLDFGLNERSKSPPAVSRFQTASPTFPQEAEQNDAATFNRSVQPNDRGKATAMGLFNKPQRNFDEQQFLQRQLQMHEGRNSPQIPNSRSASRASPELTRSERQSNTSMRSLASPPIPERSWTSPIPPIPSQSPSPAMMNHPSNDSSSRNRSKSSASGREAAVKARIESLIKRQNAELAAMEAEQLGPMRTKEEERSESVLDKETNGGTFFDNSDGSDDESQFERPSADSRAESNRLAPNDIHPAFRDFNFNTESPEPSHNRQSTNSSKSRSRQSVENDRTSTANLDADLSSSNQAAGLGLSGMIRTHLRHDSDRSSIFPPPSPALPQFQNHDFRKGSEASITKTLTESRKSDAYENSIVHSQNAKLQPSETAQMPTHALADKAQQILGLASALRSANIATTDSTSTAQESTLHGHRAEMMKHADTEHGSHNRNASTETQKEQQRFDDELAERRRRIQEQLRSVNDRSTSREHPGQGFGMPRFGGKFSGPDRNQDSQAKAMKMLGLSNSRTNGELWGQEAAQDRDVPARFIQRPATVQDDYRNGRHTPNSRRPTYPRPAPNDAYDRPPPPRSTTPSGRSSARDRSNSGAGDRSMSRNKHYTDDSEPMPNRYNTSTNAMSPPHRDARRPILTPEERTYDRSASAAAGSYRDRQGYFNAKPMPPPEVPNDFTPRASPRPSGHSAASAYESPINMPMSPPASAAPSPNPPFNGASNGRATPIGGRKKSVTKGMISEPTFVSSTSSVPLVHLPQGTDPMNAPPIPAMNPRRRGTNASDENVSFTSRSAPNPIPNMHESSRHGSSDANRAPTPKQRNRLRKTSSEGGNMAAKARAQALLADIARERERSPAVQVFPNRSATALGMTYQGGMF